jgi:hypothetical protein
MFTRTKTTSRARRGVKTWLLGMLAAFSVAPGVASASMLGSGPRARMEQFVRVGGGMYWRYDDSHDVALIVPHTYTYVGNRGTALVSDPAVVSWGTGRTDVFVINQSQTIDHGGLNPGQGGFVWWDNWGSPVPGHTLVGISAVSGRSGLLDVFVTDSSPANGTNSLYHRRWDNGTDTNWQLVSVAGLPSRFGGPGAVAGGSNGPDSWDVFVRGWNTATLRWNIYHVMAPAGTYVYAADNIGDPGGASLNSDPHAASWSNGRMDVVVSDAVGAIRHIYSGVCSAHTPWYCTSYQWFWNTWGSPAVGSAPNVVAYGPNNLHVYARQASDSSLIDCRWENGDYGCVNKGGWFEGGPGTGSSAVAAPTGDRLTAEQWLSGNSADFINSMDSRFRLYMQPDCNLVLYQHPDGGWPADPANPGAARAMWASNTAGAGSNCWAVMQGDGNFVLYANPWNGGPGQAIWATNTAGHPGAFVTTQGDGNTVLYDNRTALWATNTVIAPAIPAASGSADPHQGCQFSRTETSCYGVIMTCNHIWVCGWNYQNLTPIEKADGAYVCGGCLGFDW